MGGKPIFKSFIHYGKIVLICSLLFTGCGGSGGGSSSGGPSGNVPAVPTGVIAKNGTGARMIIINWTPVQGANSYNIYFDTVQGISKMASQLISPVTNPPYTFSNLQTGTLYYFVVTAVNDNGESAFSSEVSWRAP